MLRVVLIGLFVLTSVPADAEEWSYEAVLYGWLAGLDGTIGFGDAAEQEVSATFEDLAGFVDFAMAGHFEARNSGVVLLTDISYTGLGADREGQVGNQTVEVDLDIDQWILELGGGYRVSSEFDLLLAGRYYILDMGATSASIAGESTGDATQSWADIYLGARYTRLLGENWFASVRGDVGAGGSDFAWFGNVALGYRFNERFSTALAWRVLSLDREGDADARYFKYDVVQNGLGIALGFGF